MIRTKYVEERFPRYFIFGTSAAGKVDVSSTKIDPVATVASEAAAEVLTRYRDAAVDMIIRLAQILSEVDPQAFNDVWY